MNELLERLLNDASARDAAELPSLASAVAEDFIPWNDIAAQ